MRESLKIGSVLQFVSYLILLLGCGGVTSCFSQANEKKTPYGWRPFDFSYSNVTDSWVQLASAKVLANDARCGRVGAGRGGASIGYTRKDCTPKALLENPARFTWWKIDDIVGLLKRTPQPPHKKIEQSISFPEFDVEAAAWRCHYTLVDDKTWVGKFVGTLAKPLGAAAKEGNANGDSWLHCHFRNLADTDVHIFAKINTRGREINSNVDFVPADNRFHGFSAHSGQDSIYRLEAEDTLEIEWASKKSEFHSPAKKKQKIVFPKFSEVEKNWHCYFTLNRRGEWVAEFEGTSKTNKGVKDE